MKPRFFERLGMFVALICLSLLCAVGARAQETGDIVGTVTDSTGAVVPNATVTLTNTGTNVSQTTQVSRRRKLSIYLAAGRQLPS